MLILSWSEVLEKLKDPKGEAAMIRTLVPVYVASNLMSYAVGTRSEKFSCGSTVFPSSQKQPLQLLFDSKSVNVVYL